MKAALFILLALFFTTSVRAQSSTPSATDKEERLYLAIGKGDTAAVKLCLEEGADAGATIKLNRGGAHMTMLTAAVNQGNPVIVREILSRKPDLEKKDWFNTTPLMYAAGLGNLEITKMLIEAGADVNASDGKGLTVLKAAQDGKNAEVVALIEAKLAGK